MSNRAPTDQHVTPTALAVILARSGSKGVPGKNLAAVGGRPCVAWTIDAAKGAGSVAAVVLSTDDAKIAEIGHAMGATVILRPAHLATDTARVDDATRHAVVEWERETCAPPDPTRPVVILYANVPIRPEGLIDRACGLLIQSKCDSVQSYAPVGKHHPWWTARVGADGAVRAWEGEVLNHGVHRRQELPPAHIPDGGVLAVTRRALFLQIPDVRPGPHAIFGRDVRGLVNAEGDVVDIDSRIDLLVADAILNERASVAGTILGASKAGGARRAVREINV
ncbi:MAG: acylneuraminate cytidylyltransferase family protein [Planctomycetota bacterium]